MAPTTALFANSPEGVLEDIEKQFQLGSESLQDLAKAFLEEVNEGLGKYGHPLAMMWVSLCALNFSVVCGLILSG